MGTRRWQLVALAVVGFFGLTASSCDERGLGDAPIAEMVEEPRVIIVMPDRFPNLAIVCDGGTAIYTNTRSAGNMLAVPNSEHCSTGAR